MQVNELELSDSWIVKPDIYSDDRGFFFESFSIKNFAKHGLPHSFVQDAHSFNRNKNTFRGMHYQAKPYAQTLFVTVVSGAIYDYILDLNPKSATFGKWIKNFLSADNKNILVLSHGFAHGFLTLEDNTTVLYKMGEFYNKESERHINYKDRLISLDIADKKDLIVSEKDFTAPFLTKLPNDF